MTNFHLRVDSDPVLHFRAYYVVPAQPAAPAESRVIFRGPCVLGGVISTSAPIYQLYDGVDASGQILLAALADGSKLSLAGLGIRITTGLFLVNSSVAGATPMTFLVAQSPQ